MKKINQKTKAEQFFILLLMFSITLGTFSVTGCGGQACEKPACGSEDVEDGKAIGCSVPGCGGCLSPGKGCNSSCWPQSCKFVYANGEEEDEEEDEELSSKLSIIACDTRYYGNGCLGCGQVEKTSYYGCINYQENSEKLNGFFFGSTDSDEKIIGCTNGCGGCVGSHQMGAEIISEMEDITGVN